jgi:serine/threonine protein kinase
MSAPHDCPQSRHCRALFSTPLPPEEQAYYEGHLESCGACQARLDEEVADGDGLLQRVRKVGDPAEAVVEPALAEVLERLSRKDGRNRFAAVASADLYFLRPAPRPGLLGVLGHYEVSAVQGQGGMGVVLKAFDPPLGRWVAIKVLSPSLVGRASAHQRFLREARAAAVRHEHIVTIHDVAEVDGLPYLVMQFVEGGSLQDRLNGGGALEVPEVVRIGAQVASGLAAAHAQGLIHRDIKPANILLQKEPFCVKITDFGLARVADDLRLTQSGIVVGTPEYMAPEQARGGPVDPRADLFSLGSVLYALCAGAPPFQGTPLAVLRQVCERAPAPLRQQKPKVPPWLETIITRLLAKDPNRRFQSAREVAQLLEGYLAHLQQPAKVPQPVLPDQARPARRYVLTLGLLASLVILVALALLGLFLRAQAPVLSEPPMPQEYRHSSTISTS